MSAGAKGAQFEGLPDVGGHVRDDERAKPGSLAIRSGRHGLHVARPERTAVDVQLALDDSGVGDDHAVEVEDEMKATDRVIPILAREAIFLVCPESHRHQCPDRGDLGQRQILGREPAEMRAIGRDLNRHRLL